MLQVRLIYSLEDKELERAHVHTGQTGLQGLDAAILSCLKSSTRPWSKGEKQLFLQTSPFSVFFKILISYYDLLQGSNIVSILGSFSTAASFGWWYVEAVRCDYITCKITHI